MTAPIAILQGFTNATSPPTAHAFSQSAAQRRVDHGQVGHGRGCTPTQSLMHTHATTDVHSRSYFYLGATPSDSEEANPRNYHCVGAAPSDVEEATPCDNFVSFA